MPIFVRGAVPPLRATTYHYRLCATWASVFGSLNLKISPLILSSNSERVINIPGNGIDSVSSKSMCRDSECRLTSPLTIIKCRFRKCFRNSIHIKHDIWSSKYEYSTPSTTVSVFLSDLQVPFPWCHLTFFKMFFKVVRFVFVITSCSKW